MFMTPPGAHAIRTRAIKHVYLRNILAWPVRLALRGHIDKHVDLVLLRQGARKRTKVISTRAHSRCHVTIDEDSSCAVVLLDVVAEGGTVVVIRML